MLVEAHQQLNPYAHPNPKTSSSVEDSTTKRTSSTSRNSFRPCDTNHVVRRSNASKSRKSSPQAWSNPSARSDTWKWSKPSEKHRGSGQAESPFLKIDTGRSKESCPSTWNESRKKRRNVEKSYYHQLQAGQKTRKRSFSRKKWNLRSKLGTTQVLVKLVSPFELKGVMKSRENLRREFSQTRKRKKEKHYQCRGSELRNSERILRRRLRRRRTGEGRDRWTEIMSWVKYLRFRRRKRRYRFCMIKRGSEWSIRMRRMGELRNKIIKKVEACYFQ